MQTDFRQWEDELQVFPEYSPINPYVFAEWLAQQKPWRSFPTGDFDYAQHCPVAAWLSETTDADVGVSVTEDRIWVGNALFITPGWVRRFVNAWDWTNRTSVWKARRILRKQMTNETRYWEALERHLS